MAPANTERSRKRSGFCISADMLPPRGDGMRFTKMQGIGNDYIYVNAFEETVREPEKLARRVSDRHFGIGGDGLVLIGPSSSADFRMRMFNLDGSEGAMCGNAARCIGKYVYERGLTDKTDFLLETGSGIKQIHLNLEGGSVRSVSVDMGKPRFLAREIPVAMEDGPNIPLKVSLPWRIPLEGYCVSMGNPHCVIFPKEDIDLIELGKWMAKNPLFPDGVNTELVWPQKDGTLIMRVYERGSGETLACGTGACAVLVVANMLHLSPEENMVHLLGGDLKIRYLPDGRVIKTGPAAFVFDGEWPEDEDI